MSVKAGRLFPLEGRSLLFKKNRKQSFCGEPRGSERSLFQVCCPGPGSVSKESDSAPSFPFSGGIPGFFFSESQPHDPVFQQALKDPEFEKAVRGSELCLMVRERERLRDCGSDSCRVSNVGRLGLRSNSAGCGGGFAPVLASCSVGEGGALDASAVAPSATSAGDEVGCAPLSFPNSVGGGVGAVPDEVVRSSGERGGPESRADVGEGVRSSTADTSAGIVRSLEFVRARATAGERSGGIGLLEEIESDFPSLSYSINSCRRVVDICMCTCVSCCRCLSWSCCSCLRCFISLCGVCCCTCACHNLARCKQFR